LEETEARDTVARVETLLEELETLADPTAREKAMEVVQAVLELYGEGLERMVEEVAERDRDGDIAVALADDELVSHLLLLHDLHPVPLEARVGSALESVRPYMESHGGNVELVSIDDGVVRLRLEGSCDGCPSSASTMKLAIEEAIHKIAPDVVDIEADGVIEVAHQPNDGPQLLQIEVSDSLRKKNGSAWTVVDGMPDGGGRTLKEVSGEPVLFLRLKKGLYAYRPDCPSCSQSLADASLDAGHLVCEGCGRRYDVSRAGRSDGDPALHLEPVPLLHGSGGEVRVAVGAPA
jgi:Fe-S cluster biogenesis protein NfuA/nitrite reductase/ring-hydroxylating ferredoxin subunit